MQVNALAGENMAWVTETAWVCALCSGVRRSLVYYSSSCSFFFFFFHSPLYRAYQKRNSWTFLIFPEYSKNEMIYSSGLSDCAHSCNYRWYSLLTTLWDSFFSWACSYEWPCTDAAKPKDRKEEKKRKEECHRKWNTPGGVYWLIYVIMCALRNSRSLGRSGCSPHTPARYTWTQSLSGESRTTSCRHFSFPLEMQPERL